MRKYNAESSKHNRKRFISIVKAINFSYLPIIFLCLTHIFLFFLLFLAKEYILEGPCKFLHCLLLQRSLQYVTGRPSMNLVLSIAQESRMLSGSCEYRGEIYEPFMGLKSQVELT